MGYFKAINSEPEWQAMPDSLGLLEALGVVVMRKGAGGLESGAQTMDHRSVKRTQSRLV